MTRKILIATFYSIIAFCIVSYISVMYSLLNIDGVSSQKPVTNLGFPFKYYVQFWLNGADSPNWGWDINSFFIDFLIIWILTLIIFLIIKRKK